MKTVPIFSKLRDSRLSRLFCAFMILNLMIEIISPTMAMALTAGPASPEFSSFEPVATTDMVNEFTGDFTYNIPILNLPGPDGGGYSMSLAYHSGASSEEESSWVGYGWTLNPGAINRNKRGYPDEFKGTKVVNYNKLKPNYTETAKFDFNMEFNSKDRAKGTTDKDGKAGKALQMAQQLLTLASGLVFPPKPGNSDDEAGGDISLSLSHTVRYNNYSGFSIANGLGIGVFGAGNLSMNRSGGQNTYGFSVNPMAIYKMGAKLHEKNKEKAGKDFNNNTSTNNEKQLESKNAFKNVTKVTSFKTFLKAMGQVSAIIAKGNLNRVTNSWYHIESYNAPAVPYSVAKTRAFAWNYSSSVQFNPSGPLGFQVGVAGHMNLSATEGQEEKSAYGYMYSGLNNDNSNENIVHDFQLEKETTFNRQDKNLAVPFNNADLFSASGGGVIGGFRFRHNNIGVYYPNKMENVMKIRQLGVEWGIGATMQFGLDIGVGKQTTKVNGKWKQYTTPNNQMPAFSSGLPEMRFMNDNGGEVDYSTVYGSDELIYGQVDKLGIGGEKRLSLDNSFNLSMDQNKSTTSSNIYYDFYEDPTDDKKNYITGIHVTNQEGNMSHYGQPVYTRNETALSIGLEDNNDGTYITTHPLYHDAPLNNKNVTGQKVDEKYAGTFLLTGNTSFNYVDADNVYGPSEGDFGGWTKFGYKQAYGDNGQGWYRYRSPYNGLMYNGGRMVDKTDQMGSVSSGEKEVYYLKCIESKSHIAFFVTNKTSPTTFTTDFPMAEYPSLYSNGQPISTVTLNIQGSGEDRMDGLDAAPVSSGMDLAAASRDAKGSHRPHKLERVVLFAKNDLSKPLTTTFFDYDYSICPQVPNNDWTSNTPSNQRGKLTLKKIWTESNGVLRSQIAPYQFHYDYYNKYEASITAKYPWAAEFNNTSATLLQNPGYADGQLDAWGNYREDGANRVMKEKFFVAQTNGSSSFDPAAWQLKRIQLPSGGEIHVHYEQKDYNYVQNERAMVMVSLLPNATENNSYYTRDGGGHNNAEYKINLSDINVAASSAVEYKRLLVDHFINKRNKLYFKALYSLRKNKAPDLNNGQDFSQYITGYTVVNDVVLSGNDIILQLGDTREGKDDKTLPRYVCYQELLTNGGKNLGPNAESYKDEDFTNQVYANDPVQETELKKISRKRIRTAVLGMFSDWVSGQVKNTLKVNACKELDYVNSYFKLPTFHAKKGGGIRVKRVIAYDKGIAAEGGADAMVTGLEYNYKKKRTGRLGTGSDLTAVDDVYESESSGVAVNEPTGLREENALVGFLARKNQPWINKILNGRDTKQFEGFMGESILPDASVVHSHVIVKNIHSNNDDIAGRNTGTGYVVNEYHTPRDHPFFVDWSELKKENNTMKRRGLHLPLGLFNMDVDRAWVTQGYLFKINDMSGKMKSSTTYPSDVSNNPEDYNSSTFTSRTTYNYSAPGEDISTLVYDPVAKMLKRTILKAGTEEDYSMYCSDVREKTVNFSIELDLNVTLLLANVYPGIPCLSYSYSDDQLAQFLTSKVVNQTSFLLSTTTENGGIKQCSENLAFDRYSGNPVLTRTYDVFMGNNTRIRTSNDGSATHDGYYYSLNIPAAWIYEEMGPKTSSNGLNQNRLSEYAGNVVTYGASVMYDRLMTTNLWSPVTDPLNNVVSATAVKYSNGWFGASDLSEYPNLNFQGTSSPLVLAALPMANMIYYPLQTFNYKDVVKNPNAANGRIYEGGVISQPFKFFDWLGSPTSIAPEWYSDSRVTKYSPYGYPVEEEDVLTIKSAALFGYNNMLPIAVGQNAAKNEIVFVDFEHGLSSVNGITANAAHSGRKCFDYIANPGYIFATSYPLNNQKGLSIKLWMKSFIGSAGVNFGLKNPNPLLKASIGSQLFDFKKIAQTGEWTLYSADISNFNGLTGSQNIKLSYNPAPGELVFIDDFRVQPLNASVNCSSYYSDNKLAMQFDDQHFGVIYEYDNKGQLVRKSIETERGRKTLQEKQYNTPLINKN